MNRSSNVSQLIPIGAKLLTLRRGQCAGGALNRLSVVLVIDGQAPRRVTSEVARVLGLGVSSLDGCLATACCGEVLVSRLSVALHGHPGALTAVKVQ